MVALLVLGFFAVAIIVDYWQHRPQYKRLFAPSTEQVVFSHPIAGLTMADGGKPMASAQYLLTTENDTRVLERVVDGKTTPVGCFSHTVSNVEIGKMVRALNT
jgi:hypothetical protein